jgi:hypothetical protein
VREDAVKDCGRDCGVFAICPPWLESIDIHSKSACSVDIGGKKTNEQKERDK